VRSSSPRTDELSRPRAHILHVYIYICPDTRMTDRSELSKVCMCPCGRSARVHENEIEDAIHRLGGD
jgi:hypothetical protein